MWDEWVIDATMSDERGLIFVPVEGGMENPTFVTGMMYAGG